MPLSDEEMTNSQVVAREFTMGYNNGNNFPPLDEKLPADPTAKQEGFLEV